MRISLLCSDEQHPFIGHLTKWIIDQREFHSVELLHEKKDLSGGDILFLLHCNGFINEKENSINEQ